MAWLTRMTGKPYRLLAEAEYEYAARAGTTTAYPWGDEIGKDHANCRGCGSRWDGIQPAPVGSFDPNGFSLYNMAGNVWEWLEDCYHPNYDGAPKNGSDWKIACPDLRVHVFRGGSWSTPPGAAIREPRQEHHRQPVRQPRFSGRPDAYTLMNLPSSGS